MISRVNNCNRQTAETEPNVFTHNSLPLSDKTTTVFNKAITDQSQRKRTQSNPINIPEKKQPHFSKNISLPHQRPTVSNQDSEFPVESIFILEL